MISLTTAYPSHLFTVTVKGNSAYQLLKPLITMKRVFFENGEKVGEMVTIGVRGTQQWCIYNKLLEKKN